MFAPRLVASRMARASVSTAGAPNKARQRTRGQRAIALEGHSGAIHQSVFNHQEKQDEASIQGHDKSVAMAQAAVSALAKA